jgi:hypothetical protein
MARYKMPADPRRKQLSSWLHSGKIGQLPTFLFLSSCAILLVPSYEAGKRAQERWNERTSTSCEAG